MNPFAFYADFLKGKSTPFLKRIEDIHRHPARGTLEEIGGGVMCQQFLQGVSGASHTLIAGMSHYSKAAQKTRYGTFKRSVDYESSLKMAEHNLKVAGGEFALVISASLSSPECGGTQHAWLVLLTPHKHLALHCRFKLQDRKAQQIALGILGVYLIHHGLIEEGVSLESHAWMKSWVEIDWILDSHWDLHQQRKAMVSLVREQWTPWVFFKQGLPQRALLGLRDKALLIQKGAFNPPTLAHENMLTQAQNHSDDATEALYEITINNVDKAQAGLENYAHRIAMLAHANVLLSTYGPFYSLKEALMGWGQAKAVHFVMGEDTHARLYEDRYYTYLQGGRAEGMARLFNANTQLYVFARNGLSPQEKTPQTHSFSIEWPISSTEIRQAIQAHQENWQANVRPNVAEYIRVKALYQHQISALE